MFRDSTGAERGRQRLTKVEPDRVEYRLRNDGSGKGVMTPEVDFRATAPLPYGVRHAAELVLGRRVRRLHDEDLERLKAHVEQAPSSAG